MLSKKRFYVLREFTLEGGQEEIERQNQLRKQQAEVASRGTGRTNSMDSLRSPISVRSPSLSNVPEEHSAFAIGDEEESDEDEASASLHVRTNDTSSMEDSRADSLSSPIQEAVPTQLRGMSEKARGKMPVGQPSFSRQNSISSLHSLTQHTSQPGQFQPTAEWVCGLLNLICSHAYDLHADRKLADGVAASHHSHATCRAFSPA
jgi:hypothetical protein